MTDGERPFLCSDCGHQNQSAGNCQACGQGPLLDSRQPGVIDMLLRADQERHNQRRQLAVWASLPVAVVMVLVVVFAVPQLLDVVPLPIPFARAVKAVVLMVLAAAGVSRAIHRAFPAKPRFPYLQESTPSIADVAGAMRRGSTRRIVAVATVIAAGGAVIATAAGIFNWYEKRRAQEAHRKGAEAFAALSACLVGEPQPDASSTGDGESIAQRVRKIELSIGKIEDTPSEWPGRCRVYADGLYRVLEGKGPTEKLRHFMTTKMTCASGCKFGDLAPQVTELHAAAAHARFPDVDAPGVPRPPPAGLRLLSASSFARLGPPDLALRDHSWLGDGTLALLFSSSGAGLTLCEVDAKNPQPSAACSTILDNPQVIAASSAKLVQGESEPIVHGITRARVTAGRGVLGEDRSARPLAGDLAGGLGLQPHKAKGKDRRESSSDKPPEPDIERGAFHARTGDRVEVAHGDETALRNGFLLEKSEDAYVVSAVSDGTVQGKQKLKPPGGGAAFITGEHVAWVAEDKQGKGVFYRKLSAKKPILGDVKRAGPLSSYGSEPPLTCQSENVMVLLFGHGTDAEMSFLTADGWSSPVRATEAPVVIAPKESPPKPSPEAPRPAPKKQDSQPDAPRPAPTKEEPQGDAQKQAKAEALKQAAEFGMIGLLNAGAGGDPDAPTVSWGRDSLLDSIGSDRTSMGSMAGDRSRPLRSSQEFTCGPTEATFTVQQLRGGDVTVQKLRCTREGCKRWQVRLGNIRAKSVWVATDLDGKVLLVWRTDLGDLRMRLAPIEDLANQSDVILMDSPEHGGPQTGDLHVFVRGAQALLFFRGAALHALRIDSSGSFEAIAQP